MAPAISQDEYTSVNAKKEKNNKDTKNVLKGIGILIVGSIVLGRLRKFGKSLGLFKSSKK